MQVCVGTNSLIGWRLAALEQCDDKPVWRSQPTSLFNGNLLLQRAFCQYSTDIYYNLWSYLARNKYRAGFYTGKIDMAWPPTWPEKSEELHILDPNGDVLLIFERRPEIDVAEYLDEESFAHKWEDEPKPTTENPFPDGSMSKEPAPDWLEPHPSTKYDPDTVGTEAGAELDNEPARPQSSTDSVSTASWTESKIQKVQIRVSSKHLILASATFRRCLGSDEFLEGRTLQTTGNVVIQLVDEDPDSMVIILCIIHGLTRKVPRQVNLETLTKLAFVVNHRQIHEAVEPFSDIWIENLKRGPLSSSYIPEVLSWLFIFWVFQKEDGFRQMSQILECESDHRLEDEVHTGTPIPASIISEFTPIKDIPICFKTMCKALFKQNAYTALGAQYKLYRI
ncbi:hypothetical protein BP6252_13163 [Coleophoma cylindrospora]|uniref:BTB domain-containing protein n=1 Tax=Coleophoma cylindrospora TaxID=1849047 RepID=A0A3D8QAI8_9HELO|nr:hypothetical protein BP6252_13163 [Coleophoma cylindrospora]